MSAPAFVFAGLCAAFLAGCGAGGKPAVDTARIVDTIKADEVRWNTDYRSGDPGRIAAHFAPDAVAMTPGASPAVGTAAIQAAAGRLIGQPGFRLTFASSRVDVAASGDLAAARGAYSLTTTDPATGAPLTGGGSYVTVYKPMPGGVWKAAWDITTPGPLASASPPATAGAR